MTVGEALSKRLEIYEPAECERWHQFVRRLTTTTTHEKVVLAMPGFRCDMRRVVPIKSRSRWMARQLALAIKMHEATTT